MKWCDCELWNHCHWTTRQSYHAFKLLQTTTSRLKHHFSFTTSPTWLSLHWRLAAQTLIVLILRDNTIGPDSWLPTSFGRVLGPKTPLHWSASPWLFATLGGVSKVGTSKHSWTRPHCIVCDSYRANKASLHRSKTQASEGTSITTGGVVFERAISFVIEKFNASDSRCFVPLVSI